MNNTKDPGIEFIKYSTNQFCKSLLNSCYDPLVWNKNIGYLPGSTLKFRHNKMGMLELWEENKQVNTEELKDSKENINSESLTNVDLIVTKKEKDDSTTEILDESNEKFLNDEKLKNGVKNPLNTSSYGRKRKRRIIDGEVVGFSSKTRREKLDRDSSKSKTTNFDWTEYLKSINGKSVPTKLFDNIGIRFCGTDMESELKHNFKVNQKLEGIDPNNESLFCVFTIVEISGYRLRLHFDGYQDQFDFWTMADSQLIFPAGWCEKNNRKLQPPKDYNYSTFAWSTYLAKTKSEAAHEDSFFIIKNAVSAKNTFKIGLKLEAVDKRNSGMICVATIKDIIGDHVLVHFDGWDSSYDMWAHCCSPLLLPIGYCEDNEKVLSIPSAYGHDLSSFSWESYLQLTNSESVPNSIFKERNQWWFDLEVGMRCEVIDKRCPQLIRVGHIAKLNEEFQVTIGFDDWSEKYNYKIDLGSSWVNILPVGWCAKTGCVLQPPPTFDASIESSVCPIYGCKGYGHVKGPRYSNHQRISGCPYAECNLHKDFKSTDRIPISVIQSIDNVDGILHNIAKVEEVPTENVKLEPTVPVQKQLEIEIPTNDVEPMDLSMKEYKIPAPIDIVPSLTMEQNEISEESQIFNNSPCDFNRTKLYDFPPSLSLQEIKDHDENFDLFREDQKFFFQYHPPKNLIPNPVAIVSSSVLRPYTNRTPYHPSDDYRRIMEWNIVEQILPPLKVIKDENTQIIQEIQSNKNCKTKGKPKVTLSKKNQYSNISDHIRKMNIKKSILQWNCHEVSQLISSLIGTDQYTNGFIEHEVDGAAFMCLKQMDLMKVLGMKLGPAIKLSSSIQYLRQLFPESKLSDFT